VSREFFRVMGIPLRRGRVFDETDGPSTEPVAVIDEAFAQKYFPGEDPIGRRISHNLVPGNARIIGVVGTVAHQGLTDEPSPGRYVLMEQTRFVPAGSSLVMRVGPGRDAVSVLREAREAVQRTTSIFAVQDATTMEQIVALAMGPTRRVMQLMTLIGALALTLGAIGVYGVVSHFVNRRRRDWVIRMALGMKPVVAMRQVVRRGAVLVGAGCAFGLVASLAATRIFSSLLYQVSAADPIALAAAAGLLIVTGCVAAFVPALRASRANPAAALRES
jgi:hypothetical protein